ncbi:MAG TPA: Gfo/Idh/MocA family oxidoreductase [candidate division Zixibacteria bacterium]|jgi:predicted dehydrogenase
MTAAAAHSDPVRVGVIGAGYWGPNLIRNVSINPRAVLTAVADSKPERRDFVAVRYPGCRIYDDAKKLIAADDIDAVIIATPVNTHFALAKAALESGKHVLLEKPMCASVAECDDLIALATGRGLTLMVDHTFLYTGAVRRILELVDAGELGEILYFDSVRVNLGLFQHDVNVLWDLAPHDLSIMDAIVKKPAVSVAAQGRAHFDRQIEDIAYLTVTFAGDAIAHFHVNWLAPVKVRHMLIGGAKKMIFFDDNEPSEKVKVYDKGVQMPTDVEEVHRALVQYRIGDMHAPHIDGTEALTLVTNEFIGAIRDKRPPRSDAESGRRVVSILEAADRSLKQGGAPVPL